MGPMPAQPRGARSATYYERETMSKPETIADILDDFTQVDKLDGLLRVKKVYLEGKYPKGPPLSLFVVYPTTEIRTNSDGTPEQDLRIEQYTLLATLSSELRKLVRAEIAALVEDAKKDAE